MIGLGTDIIEIERIRRAIQRERFVSHAFTPQEQAWLETKAKNKAESAAGLFCAKEAVAKALGTGFQRGLNLKDIEITHNALGAPQVHKPQGNFLLSISHCREYATATAILLGDAQETTHEND